MKKYFRFCFVAIFFLASLGQLVHSQDRVLKVGIDPTYEPFTYRTQNFEAVGFDIDIAKAICRQLNMRCVFVEQDWDDLIPNLNAVKYDVIISSMFITQERLSLVAFSDIYYKTPSRLVLRKGIDYINPGSINGKKIGVLKHSTEEKFAQGELLPVGVNIISYDQMSDVYNDMVRGKLDGTVNEYIIATDLFLSKRDGDKFYMPCPDLTQEKYFGKGAAVALRKSDVELKNRINVAIANINSSGEYSRINKKYFNIDISGSKSSTQSGATCTEYEPNKPTTVANANRTGFDPMAFGKYANLFACIHRSDAGLMAENLVRESAKGVHPFLRLLKTYRQYCEVINGGVPAEENIRNGVLVVSSQTGDYFVTDRGNVALGFVRRRNLSE